MASPQNPDPKSYEGWWAYEVVSGGAYHAHFVEHVSFTGNASGYVARVAFREPRLGAMAKAFIPLGEMTRDKGWLLFPTSAEAEKAIPAALRDPYAFALA